MIRQPKFAIGDTLTHVVLERADVSRYDEMRMLVVYIRTDECSVARQLSYGCRSVWRDGRVSTTISYFNEIELIKAEPFKTPKPKGTDNATLPSITTSGLRQ